MATEQQIIRAQNQRLTRFLEVYDCLHSKGLSSEEVKEAMKSVGRPTINIATSTGLLNYLKAVCDSLSTEDQSDVGFLD